MQVTLNAIDWEQMTSFGSSKNFIDWYIEDPEDGRVRVLSCQDYNWADSAMLYNEVADVMEHLATICDSNLANSLRGGVMKLIANSPLVDDFHTAEASDGCFWLSASPSSTALIKTEMERLDLDELVRVLKKNPAEGSEEIVEDLDEYFVGYIEMHLEMVNLAVSRGYGLLGHCG